MNASRNTDACLFIVFIYIQKKKVIELRIGVLDKPLKSETDLGSIFAPRGSILLCSSRSRRVPLHRLQTVAEIPFPRDFTCAGDAEGLLAEDSELASGILQGSLTRISDSDQSLSLGSVKNSSRHPTTGG
jgi:hypothetical protein